MGGVAAGPAPPRVGDAPSPQGLRAGSFLWWFVVPAFCAVVVALAVRDLPGAWRTGNPGGVHGRFVVVSQVCERGCTTFGDFTSDDRQTKRRVPYADAPSGLLPGASLRAVLDGDVAQREETSLRWLLVGAVGLAFALGLGAWAVTLYVRLTGRHGT